jgi:pyrroline-5-carboxylate reductase
MAEALIGGVLARKLVGKDAMVASHPRPERREELEKRYGIAVVAGNREILERANLVFLCVKPQMLLSVLGELAGAVPSDRLVVSIVAGATTAVLGTALKHAALIRAMPNTPAQIGAGTTVWYATPETPPAQRARARSVLAALGTEVEVQDEELIAMATAVSGTGPTYVFLVMEALIDSAVHLGFPRHLAHALVLDTMLGSVRFAQHSGKHPAQLRDMVTSPGGTSAAALHALEAGRLRTVLADAVWAAYRRTQSLAEGLSVKATTQREKEKEK